MDISPLYAAFSRAAQATPGKTAVILGEESRSYAQLLGEVDRLASRLGRLGVAVGDRIGIVLPNSIEFVRMLFAAARLGAVLVPQSPGCTPEAARRTFAAAGVNHLVCWHGVAAELFPASGQGAGLRLSVGGKLPGWLALEETADDEPLLEPARLPAGHPYLILLTSGSTGAPKPILLSQDTKVARAGSAISLYGLTADEVVLAATPMHHSLAQRLVLLPLTSGATSVIMPRYTAQAWLDTAERHDVSFTMAVSSQLRQVIPLLEDRPAPSRLRCLVSSSAALDPTSKAQLLARIPGCAFHEIYGASEIASATNLDARAHPSKLDSVGLPIAGVEVQILGRDQTLLPAGEAGEIICRTPFAFAGYYQAPDITHAAMWQDYFRTGDEGRLDEDGFLYFLGRIKDIIIVGGINVYPRDIEDIVEQHEDVAECAAIPVADAQLGEVVGLVIAPRPGASLKLRTLRQLCANRLDDAQQPHHYFQVDQLPRNEMGKIDKPTLRARFSSLPRQET